jgi:hypothetical protein
MTIVDVADAASEQRTFAPLGENERMWLGLLANQEVRRHIREQEEATIEAEDYWGQAEVACDVDPIG